LGGRRYGGGNPVRRRRRRNGDEGRKIVRLTFVIKLKEKKKI
jgi:hypothetical protein